jgi:bile acid:Na+ symporter, BASS family
MQMIRKASLIAAVAALVVLIVGGTMRSPSAWQPAALLLAVGVALGIGAFTHLRTYQFTLWIVAAVVAGMLYPGAILHKWPLPAAATFDLRNKWLILLIVQMVMFGMGTQMSLHDFAGVVKNPRGVGVGIVCHFSIMPLVGFALTRLFHFPNEIAAGIILIGSCSSGLASNVMAYLARSNLALSVTVTAVTTIVAPLMTPLWMKLLANQLVAVKFLDMMVEIIRIVIVPIGAALLHDYLKHATPRGRGIVRGIAGVSAAWLAFLALGGWRLLSTSLAHSPNGLMALSLLGFVLGAVVFGVVYHRLTRSLPHLDEKMPVASMFGIVYFTTVTTAAGRDNLLAVGAMLFVASVLHNAAGYCFGYFLSRGAGLDKNSARSVAFEVGLQNGGMATGLASAMGKLATVGLAPAIFSPWMNVSGSLLANYWRRRPVEAGADLLPHQPPLAPSPSGRGLG